MKIAMLHDNVLVLPLDVETSTPGGVLLPQTAALRSFAKGKAVAVGQGLVTTEGVTVPLRIEADDIAYYQPDAGFPVKLGGVDYRVMAEGEIFAIEPGEEQFRRQEVNAIEPGALVDSFFEPPEGWASAFRADRGRSVILVTLTRESDGLQVTGEGRNIGAAYREAVAAAAIAEPATAETDALAKTYDKTVALVGDAE